MSDNTTTSGGIGLMGALFLVLLVLKFLEIEPVASWSWWWVAAPLWGPVVLTLVVVVFIMLPLFLIRRR